MSKTTANQVRIKIFDLSSGADLIITNITEDEIRSYAKVYKFSKKSIDKILLGPDRYNFIRAKGYCIQKRFVSEEEFKGLKLNDYSPLMKQVDQILAEKD